MPRIIGPVNQRDVGASINAHNADLKAHPVPMLAQVQYTDVNVTNGNHQLLQPGTLIDRSNGAYSAGEWTVRVKGVYEFGGAIQSNGAWPTNPAHFLLSLWVDAGGGYGEWIRASAPHDNLTTASQGACLSGHFTLDPGWKVKFTCWQDTGSTVSVRFHTYVRLITTI